MQRRVRTFPAVERTEVTEVASVPSAICDPTQHSSHDAVTARPGERETLRNSAQRSLSRALVSPNLSSFTPMRSISDRCRLHARRLSSPLSR